MQTRKLVQLLSKLLFALIFLGFLIAFMIKDYSMGYNNLVKNPVIVQVVSAIGLFLVLSCLLLQIFDIVVETRLRQFLKVNSCLMGLSSLICVIGYAIASEFIPMAVTIIWLFPVAYILYLMYNQSRVLPLSTLRGESSVLSDELPEMRKSTSQQVYDLDNHKGRCKCCVLWAYFVLLAVAVLTLAVNSVVEAYSLRSYQVIGKLVEVPVYPVSQPNGPTINMRINCFGNANGKPTFLFEHGGGANGLAFQAIQQFLSENNRRSCTYDRPGYGRSQPGPSDATGQENAHRTLALLANAGESGPYIVVGWSAGVQIVQVFTHYNPANVSGMGFIDGYPNYRVLQAIDQNLTDDYVKYTGNSIISIIGLIKNLEPFGAGAIVGSSPKFHPQQMKSYYEAYYRNYGFWYAQYQDVRNPNDLTTLLTDLGDKQNPSNRPYPDAKVALNWPNITVPLLIMPANATINGTGNFYITQCQKYLSKSTSGQMMILPGEHGIVYQEPSVVANNLLTFFT